MAGGILAKHDGRSSHQRRSSPTGVMKQGSGWVPVALGATVVVAGLRSRNKGAAGVALAALAGVAAVAAMRGGQLNGGMASKTGQGGEPEVERSMTIGISADELRRCWLDPKTLPKVMAGLARVQAVGNGRTRWRIEAPLGRIYEWESETVDEGVGNGVGWRSLPNASIANEGSMHFRPALGGRGTVATLRLRFDPPGGTFGDMAVGLLGTTPLDLAVDGVLRRFKSLAETGEVPTTERQPAARANTR